MFFLRRGVIWKNYGHKSVLYDLQNNSTLTLNDTSTRILEGLIVYRNEKKKIASSLHIENPECEYNTLLNDVTTCYNTLLSTPFFTSKPEEATSISLIGTVTSLETATLEITKRCNLKCKHCYQGLHDLALPDISLGNVRLIAEKLGELGIHSIILTGGEPFLHENLLEIIESFNDKNIRVTIFTNGQVYNKKVLNKLSNLNIQVRISLEGHIASLNDEIRGQGTFYNAEKFANTCAQNYIPIGYSFTINNLNEQYFFDLLNYAESMGADEIEASEVLSINSQTHASSLTLSENQSKNFRVNTLRGFAISKPFRKGMGLYRHKRDEHYICSAGTTNIFIDSTGKIYPCNLFSNIDSYYVGNILKDDLLELWRKNKVLQSLRHLKKLDIDSCRKCAANANCNGGCRARALIANGDIRSEIDGPFCKITRDLSSKIQSIDEHTLC